MDDRVIQRMAQELVVGGSPGMTGFCASGIGGLVAGLCCSRALRGKNDGPFVRRSLHDMLRSFVPSGHSRTIFNVYGKLQSLPNRNGVRVVAGYRWGSEQASGRYKHALGDHDRL